MCGELLLIMIQLLFEVYQRFKKNWIPVFYFYFLYLCKFFIIIDYSKGFGGKYGVQTDRFDEVIFHFILLSYNLAHNFVGFKVLFFLRPQSEL